MMRRPTAVEPVKLTMSTRGSVVSTSPTSTALDDSTLRTPAGMSVSATIAERLRQPRGVRWALHDDRAPGGERRDDLGQGDLQRVVVRHDGGDDADRFLLDPPVVGLARNSATPRSSLHSNLSSRSVYQRTMPIGVSGGAGGERERHADLGDHQRTQLFLVAQQGLVQLAEAQGPGTRGRWPTTWCRTRCGASDRPLGVGHRCVGDRTEHLAGRRVDRLERPASFGGDELAPDEQVLFVPHGEIPSSPNRPRAGSRRRVWRRGTSR